MDYEVGTAAQDRDTPVDLPPIPDRYKLDALDLISNLQSYVSFKIEYLKGTIERAARWLMERDKRWNTK